MSKYYIVARPGFTLTWVYVRKRLFLGMYKTCGHFSNVRSIEYAYAQAQELKERLEANNE